MNFNAVDQLRIKRLETDSRRVRRGDTFVAYPGETQDGRRYIGEALARGAASVLWEKRGFRWKREWHAPNLGIAQLRARAGVIASRVYGEPSAKLWMVGVTGTNGKTTCSQWVAQAFNRCHKRTAVIGTLGYGSTRSLKPLVNTTPDAVWLHARLAEFLRQGAQAVSMEVSSIGLDQDRVAGIDFDCALFTNLTRDHLDYHRTMQRYRRAKLKLFERPELKHAIVNLDDAFGRDIARRVKRRGLSIVGYGFGRHADVRVPKVEGANLSSGAAGMQFEARTPWGSATIKSALIGRHNAANLLATLAVLLASDIAFKEAVAVLATLKPVAGRMQKIGGGRLPLVLVDYAHSPDALEQVLATLRDVARGTDARIICVFGCGGDRDRGKRPLMGGIATRLADLAVITSDNPRTENPRRIIRDIRAGVRGDYLVEADRRRAIALALKQATRGDIVLIAGKGHETYQEIDGVRHPFSDAAVARAALQRLKS